MYYSDFDSFAVALKEARTFQLTVITVSGESHISSPMPIGVYERVQKYVDEALEARSPLSVWSRQSKSVHTVPASNVKSVSIQFMV